jgi:competence protein ComEC
MIISGKKWIFGFLSGLIFLNILAWAAVYDLSRPGFLEVTFFDVGQGDSIFIQTPRRHQVLIDGGPSAVILEKLGGNLPFWDRTIDLMILTHPEKDHLTGLLEVLKRYKVENILWTGVVRNTPEYDEWVRLIKKEKANIFIAEAGQKIKLAETVFNILSPLTDLQGQEFKDSNNTSVVVKLIFGGASFLFTGDIEKSAEKKLLEERIDVDSDILKIAHHGSKTSSNDDFIEQVSPEAAVIQVGKNNSYGHPFPGVLETLAKYGIKIFRTDINNDIKIVSDGETFKINE